MHLVFVIFIFTARKRSLGQGNIFSSVCQEFCSRGSASVHAGTPPPEADTPSKSRHPSREQTLPGAGTPPGAGTSPGAETPHPHPEQTRPLGADTPLHSACWEIRSTSGRYASYLLQ